MTGRSLDLLLLSPCHGSKKPREGPLTDSLLQEFQVAQGHGSKKPREGPLTNCSKQSQFRYARHGSKKPREGPLTSGCLSQYLR